MFCGWHIPFGHGTPEEKVTITNVNTRDIIPIHMKVVSDVNNKTDLILIFRPNLRFYKNDVIVDVKPNITKFSFSFTDKPE